MAGMTERALNGNGKRALLLPAFLLVLTAAACDRKPPPPEGPARAAQALPPGGTGAAASLPADDGQWTMPAKDYASTRFSGLDEVNGANVAKLQVAFTFSTGVNKGHEAAPL